MKTKTPAKKGNNEYLGSFLGDYFTILLPGSSVGKLKDNQGSFYHIGV